MFVGSLSPQSVAEQTHRGGRGGKAGDVQEGARAVAAFEISGDRENIRSSFIIKYETLFMC